MLEQLLGRLKETKLFLQFTFLRADKKTFTYRKEDALIEHIYDIETKIIDLFYQLKNFL